MRTPIIVSALGLLLLFSFSAAININDYLYPDEADATVEYLDFTYQGTQYSVVTINGENTFLLRDGDIVDDSTEISDVMYEYFQMQYYPSGDDIDDLRDLVVKYNESRNDGYDWAGKEEYTCRQVIFTDGRIIINGEPVACRDEESCQLNANLLYSAYHQGMGWGSITIVFEPLKEFSYASFGTDDILGNMTEKIDNLDPSNVVDSLTYIRDNVDELRDNAEDIEGTIFRTPRLDDADDRADCSLKCFALCPSFQLDYDTLDDIEDTADEMIENIGPYTDFTAAADEITDRTEQRLAYYGDETMASYYRNEFSPIAEDGGDAILQAEEVLSHVLDPSLSNDLGRLKELNDTITSKIENRNFTDIELDISEYEYLTTQLDAEGSNLTALYDDVKNTRYVADSLMIVLSTKEMHGYSGEKAAELTQEIEDLDVLFESDPTSQELSSIKENYDRVIKEGNALLAAQQTEPTYGGFLAFRGFAKDVNEEIAAFAGMSELIEPYQVPQHEFLAFGGFGAAVFISFSALWILMFLSLVITKKPTRRGSRVIALAVFVLVMTLIGVFSFGLYYYMEKTATAATAEEFMEDFAEKENAAISMDLAGLSTSEANAMEGCGNTLFSTLTEKNKTVTVYRIREDSCVKTTDGYNETYYIWECRDEMNAADTTVVSLQYSTTNENPMFSTVYRTEAVIRANSDYYITCPVTALFN